MADKKPNAGNAPEKISERDEGIATPNGRILYDLGFILSREPAKEHLNKLGIVIRPRKKSPTPA